MDAENMTTIRRAMRMWEVLSRWDDDKRTIAAAEKWQKNNKPNNNEECCRDASPRPQPLIIA